MIFGENYVPGIVTIMLTTLFNVYIKFIGKCFIKIEIVIYSFDLKHYNITLLKNHVLQQHLETGYSKFLLKWVK